jgi:hypothetical protein
MVLPAIYVHEPSKKEIEYAPDLPWIIIGGRRNAYAGRTTL